MLFTNFEKVLFKFYSMIKIIVPILYSLTIIFSLNSCSSKKNTEKNIQNESINNKEKANKLYDVGVLQQIVREKTENNDTILNEKDIENYLKQNPDKAKEILKQDPSFKQNVNKQMKIDQLLPNEIIKALESIFSMNKDVQSALKPDIIKLHNELMGNPGIKEAYAAGNPELVKLIDKLKELLKSLE